MNLTEAKEGEEYIIKEILTIILKIYSQLFDVFSHLTLLVYSNPGELSIII